MTIDPTQDAFDPRFKMFHELMGKKVREILLVSSPYDAWIMEEDCRLSERIVSEYRGLNLSNPPRLTWVSSAAKALAALDERRFDMVITMPSLSDMGAVEMGRAVKENNPHLPVVLFQHGVQPVSERGLDTSAARAIDRTFVWTGDTDILLAVVKSSEDRMNVARDTASAGIRVIIFVEDAPGIRLVPAAHLLQGAGDPDPGRHSRGAQRGAPAPGHAGTAQNPGGRNLRGSHRALRAVQPLRAGGHLGRPLSAQPPARRPGRIAAAAEDQGGPVRHPPPAGQLGA